MKLVDSVTGSMRTIKHDTTEIFSSNMFSVTYSVVSIGAMTTPNDAIQLSWTTPEAPITITMNISTSCGAPALFKFTEGWTGAGASPTGTLPPYSRNRLSDMKSELTVSYDATLVTGGDILWQEYVSWETNVPRVEREWVLKQNTNYAVSLFLAAVEEATIALDWTENILHGV